MKHEWKIGEVTVTVEAPEGVDVSGASVSVRSADRAAFLRAADAVGGIDVLSLPADERSYAQSALAFSDDGEKEAYVAILEPPRPEHSPAHPFFGPLRERVEREAREREDAPERVTS